MRAILLVLFLATVSATPTTYYIDYNAANDSANGTGKATPWKRAPYMAGFGGTYTHSAGDRFIFKGGVSWAVTCFPITMQNGGTSGSHDYYGVDQTWYSGGAWTRPKFDAQSTPIGGSGANIYVVANGNSYIDFDNIEFPNFYWDSTHQGWGTSVFNLAANESWHIINCYIHSWTHATHASGCNADFDLIVGGHSLIVSNCVIDGSLTADSGRFIYQASGIFTHNVISNIPNAILFEGDGEISYNDVGPIVSDFTSPDQHENALEQLGHGTYAIFGNKVHDNAGMGIFLGGVTGDGGNCIVTIYNNLMWNSTRGIESDNRYTYNTIRCYNNTLADTGITSTSGAFTSYLYATNNHIINSSIATGGYTYSYLGNNLIQTTAEATSSGYTEANLYQPTAADSPTVDQGVSISSLFTTDLLGNTRTGTWDVGAYEYGGESPPPARATTYYVSPSGDSGNTGTNAASPWTLTYALTQVWSNDTIICLDGDYQGEFVVGTNVTIRAQNKWKARILHSDATITQSGMSVWPDTVTGVVIDGLCFTNCLGRAISISGSSNTVQNCWIIRCGTAGYGATGDGYGIYAKGVNATLVQYNLVERNGSVAGYDEGIYVGGTNIVVRCNVVRSNYAFGIQFEAPSGSFNDNCWCYNNLCYSNAVGGGSAYEWTFNSDDGAAALTNYVYGNTFLSRGDTAGYVNRAVVMFTNNITQGANATGGSGTVYAGSNLESPAMNNFADNTKGRFWLTSGATARGASTVTGACGPVNFFGAAQASVTDIGAFQYSAVYAADTRTLDPSPATGANYWGSPVQPSVPSQIGRLTVQTIRWR